MDTTKQINELTNQLSDLLDNLDYTLDYIDNSELYSEINVNVKSYLESALARLEIISDDIADGLYEDDPSSEDFEEWD
jgi:hypothetical protein